MRAIYFYKIFIILFVFFVFALRVIPSARAFSPPRPCAKPPNNYDAVRPVLSPPYDPNPAPKNNQFFCHPGYAGNSEPDITYNCNETGDQILECIHYLNPSNKYTCTYWGQDAFTGSVSYLGSQLFDNCAPVVPADTISPSTVTVTAVALSSSQVSVSWTPSVDNVGVVRYEVFRFAGPCCTPISLSPINVFPPVTTYTHSGLSAGGWYGYYVLAYDAAGGHSGSFGTVYVQTPLDAVPPTDPAALSAVAASTSQINLSWSVSSDANGVAGYRIERCAGAGCTGFAQIATFSAAEYSDIGLSPSTSYSYRVRAYDAAGNLSGYSDPPASATTFTPVDATPPSVAPALSGTVISSSQINLLWTAAVDNVGIAGYEVFRNNVSVAIVGASALTYNNLGLTPSTVYSFRVEAFDAAGNRIASNSISRTTLAAPDTAPPVFTPTSPSAELPAGTTAATLGGTTNETATCRYALSAGQSFALMTPFTTTGGTTHSQPLTGLTNNTGYTYSVKCRDSANNISGDIIIMFSVLTPVPAPDTIPPIISNGRPAGVLAAGTNSATLSADTNEPAHCKYNQDADIDFLSMTGALLRDAAGTHHTAMLTGLSGGVSYQYFVRCQDDPGGRENTAGYLISFSVASPPNFLPLASFSATPLSGFAPLTVSVDGTASADPDGTIFQHRWRWGGGFPDTGAFQNGSPSTASQTYVTPGAYGIILEVTDNQGGVTATLPITITVSAVPPTPPPPSTAGICTAACTTDADCTGPNFVCAPNGICARNIGFCDPETPTCSNNAECPLSGICPAPLLNNGSITSLDGTMTSTAANPVAFPFGTTSVNMSVTTDVNAACQYAIIANTAYGASGANQFASTGLTSHTTRLTGLGTATTQSNSYTYHIRCKDAQTGDANIVDYDIAFSIGAAALVSGPHPYLCKVNNNFIRNNIPYFFNICTPSCNPDNPNGSNADCTDIAAPRCDAVKKVCIP